MKVEWSLGASADLKRLLSFLRKRSPPASRRAAVLIQGYALQLADFPDSGRPYPRNPAKYRELLIPFGQFGYTLLYEVDSERVRITHVKHQREADY